MGVGVLALTVVNCTQQQCLFTPAHMEASDQYNGVPSAPVGDGEGTTREYMG